MCSSLLGDARETLGSSAHAVARDADAPGDAVPAAGLHVRIAQVGTCVTVVSLSGDVDLATADVFTSTLSDALSGRDGGRVVLELNRVSFLAACGLGVLVAARSRATGSGTELVLVVDDVAPAAATLRFLPAQEGLRVYSTLTAAVRFPLEGV